MSFRDKELTGRKNTQNQERKPRATNGALQSQMLMACINEKARKKEMLSLICFHTSVISFLQFLYASERLCKVCITIARKLNTSHGCNFEDFLW